MSDLAIQQALVSLILNTTSVVPKTTLSAQAGAGATTVTVASATRLRRGMRLQFRDDLSEEPLRIASISGNTLTLDFTGLGYANLQKTHMVGTTVYTNIKSERPVYASRSLAAGDPLLAVVVEARDEGGRFTRHTGSTYSVTIAEHRRLLPNDGDQTTEVTIDMDTWYERQMTAARNDDEALRAMLRANWTLIRGGVAGVIKLGRWGQFGQPILKTRWTDPARHWDTDQLVFELQFEVEADIATITV